MFVIFEVPASTHFDEVLGRVPMKNVVGICSTEEKAHEGIGSLILERVNASIENYFVTLMANFEHSKIRDSLMWGRDRQEEREALIVQVRKDSEAYIRNYELSAEDYAAIVARWRTFHFSDFAIEPLVVDDIIYNPVIEELNRSGFSGLHLQRVRDALNGSRA